MPAGKRGDPVSHIRLFVAHSHKDEIAERIANALEEEGFDVWYSKKSIKVGESLTEKISKGLTEGDFLVVVLSENSVQSDWMKKELSMGVILELEKKSIFILPVRTDRCEIPLMIRDKKFADFRTSFSHGMDELLDAIGSPVLDSSPVKVPKRPKGKPIHKFVDSIPSLKADDFTKQMTELTTEEKKKLIGELIDRLSISRVGDVSSRELLLTLRLAILDNARPSPQLFKVFFDELAYRTSFRFREDLMEIVAKYAEFSNIREWIQDQALIDWFVDQFRTSSSFAAGGVNSHIVAGLGPILTQRHFGQIVEAALTNDQIHHSWGAPEHLRKLFSIHDKWLSDRQRDELKKLGLH